MHIFANLVTYVAAGNKNKFAYKTVIKPKYIHKMSKSKYR